MLVAMGAEQSEYGGIAVGSVERTEKGRNGGGLLQARKLSISWVSYPEKQEDELQNAKLCTGGLPTMTITAPSPSASGSRRQLPTVRTKHIKRENLSDEDKNFQL